MAQRDVIERSLEEGKTRFASTGFSQGRCNSNDTGVFRSSRDRYLHTYNNSLYPSYACGLPCDISWLQPRAFLMRISNAT